MRYAFLWVLLGIFLMPTPAQSQTVTLPTPPPQWDGTSRYTVLIMGLDRRPSERTSLFVRTDVMIIASYDPKTSQIGLFHIPRDIYLALPDVGQIVSVNTVLQLGEGKLAGYGAHYVMQTLQYNLGIPIQAYLMFDFTAFTTAIDALGGVVVDVPYNISDPNYPDMNYGLDPFYLRAGSQTLTGRNALRYVRTRHDDNDYARGRRQIQVMSAIRDRLEEPATLQNLLFGLPKLIQDLDGHLYSNVPFDQWVFTGLVLLESNAIIKSGGIDETNSYLYSTPNNTNARVPNLTLMPDILKDVFGEYWR